MNLVDSSGWLEYLADGKNAKAFGPAIEKTSELLVSTINIFEYLKRFYLRKMRIPLFRLLVLCNKPK